MIKLTDILNGRSGLDENKRTFDRLSYYKTYYENLSPSDFTVKNEDNIIKIYLPKFKEE